MPTATFFNLPVEKQNRIFNAAVEEFSEYRFSEASINRIVKMAKISRGSFYQYFKDKKEIYHYVIQMMAQEKAEIFNSYSIDFHEKNAFEIISGGMPYIFDWVKENPKYNKIGFFLSQEDPSLLYDSIDYIDAHVGRSLLMGLFQREKDEGNIRKDVDIELIVEMYLSISSYLLREYYSKSKIEHKVKAFFDIIMRGVMAEEGNPYEEFEKPGYGGDEAYGEQHSQRRNADETL